MNNIWKDVRIQFTGTSPTGGDVKVDISVPDCELELSFTKDQAEQMKALALPKEETAKALITTVFSLRAEYKTPMKEN